MIKVDAPQLVLDRLDLDERLAALRQELRLAARAGAVVEGDVAAEAPSRVEVAEPEAWLPDGDSHILRLYVFGPSGLKDYGSATLRCKI